MKWVVVMILNVSGRTDIVAFYSKWFINRYREGFLDVRNPFYPKNVSRIFFKDVDAILFCTKNPIPILSYLKEIDKPILFHVTLTSYKKDIEPNIPSKKMIIEAVKELSSIVGIDNLYIRYDPIFISSKYNLEYHRRAFEKLCCLLEGYVNKIIVSFIDDYKNVKNNARILKQRKFTESDYKIIGEKFSESAKKYRISVQTCFEEENLTSYGFVKGECLSHELAYRMTGKKFPNWKARKEQKCNCVQMVDVGVYNTCPHHCKYCYANYNEEIVEENIKEHHDDSSMLIGYLSNDDNLTIRKK